MKTFILRVVVSAGGEDGAQIVTGFRGNILNVTPCYLYKQLTL